jgi:hypothetical protein
MSDFEQFDIGGWLRDGLLQRLKPRDRAQQRKRRVGGFTAATLALSLTAAIAGADYSVPAYASQVQVHWGARHPSAETVAEPLDPAILNGSPEAYWSAVSGRIAAWRDVEEPAATDEIPPFL